jgi:hypothetical protein
MQINEGGNVFKDAQGQPLTQRINRADVPATVDYLEKVTGIKFPQDRWLGSTGRAASSGDLDMAVDLNKVNKDQVAAKLSQYIQGQGQDPREWVVKKGEVHFKTPIAGDAKNGYVQTDFMFFPNLDWGTFFYAGGTDSAYKGVYRNILMSSIAKQLGLKVGANGMFSRTTNQLVDGGMDPDYVASVLLGKGYDRASLKNVETIYQALAKDPQRDAKLADFREYLARDSLQEPGQVKESVYMEYNEVNFLARLRDRIVNQGMQPLVEAEEAGVGGKAKGIPHVEDYVFFQGTPGITKALAIVQHAAADPGETTTVKWDGKPAIIFGRKPDTGEFVLTDGSGFDAKGYDGLFTSPAAITNNMAQRDANAVAKGGQANRVKQLAPIYTQLWPMLNAALPKDFRGYVKGDLLYMDTPPVENGRYVFTPNTVTYRIPVNSALGKKIGASQVGVAMHTMYADQTAPREPLKSVAFNPVPGLLLADPATSVPSSIVPDAAKVKQLQNIVATQGANINKLFDPAAMRDAKIADLAKLCVDYVNSKVGQRLNPQTLLPEFGKWLQGKVTTSKYNNIANYVNDPQRQAGMTAAFEAFILLHDIKEGIRGQLDAQHPGQEGWVMATPAGYSKAVGRFGSDAFAAQNRARNNPQPQ